MGRSHRMVNGTWIINTLTTIVVLIGGLFFYNQVNTFILNHENIERGKLLSAMCDERPSYSYFARCNALHDGAACTHESQSALQIWYDNFDLECSKDEPAKTFRFPVYEPEPEEHVVAAIQ